jgi:tetratricopeptide (TPR) repeat protein
MIRCALVAVALVAGAWLVVGVRASVLEADATTVRPTVLSPLPPNEVNSGLRSLRRARLLSLDQGPRLSEVRLLVATGRREEAIALARRVAAAEPENVDGWLALYFLYQRQRDPRRAAEAARMVRELNPLAGDALQK